MFKSPINNFLSNIHQNDFGSIILYITMGPTYFTDIFVDEVMS